MLRSALNNERLLATRKDTTPFRVRFFAVTARRLVVVGIIRIPLRPGEDD
jgi:hypothetical protein